MNAFKRKRRWHCLSGQEPTEMDKTIMYWENKGKEVPTRELIKTPEQIEGIRRSGVVNTGVLDAVAAAIHEGMNTLEIDQICRKYCEEHNAIPACLNYGGDEDTPPFPMSVCTSINEVVCHGIPKEEDVLEEGDIINVDFTTILDGYYADASRMFIIGKTSPEKEQLVRVAKECLEIGMDLSIRFSLPSGIYITIDTSVGHIGMGEMSSRMRSYCEMISAIHLDAAHLIKYPLTHSTFGIMIERCNSTTCTIVRCWSIPILPDSSSSRG